MNNQKIEIITKDQLFKETLEEEVSNLLNKGEKLFNIYIEKVDLIRNNEGFIETKLKILSKNKIKKNDSK